MSDSIWRVDIVVLPKDGVSDPQGEAVKSGLALLGIEGVTRIRVGRHLEVDITAPNEAAAKIVAAQMAEQLLANLVIEQFRIETVRNLGSVEGQS